MSGLASFDPDAFIRSAPPAVSQPAPQSVVAAMPMDWQIGLARLAEMPVPGMASPNRWAQVVEDATLFAHIWHDDAVAAGWSTGNVFGFDPDDAGGPVGLIIDIEGGHVIHIDEQCAWIKQPHRTLFHYRRMPDDSRLIWALRGRR